MSIKAACLIFLIGACAGCASQTSSRHDWLGVDKAEHFAVSAAMAAAITNYQEHHGHSGCSAIRTGFVITISAGAVKELYDKKIKGTYWSLEDFGWDVLGATVGSLAAANC